jgi:hypothetical protein
MPCPKRHALPLNALRESAMRWRYAARRYAALREGMPLLPRA